MRIGLVVYGPLDRRSGGYLYDREVVDELTARGHTVVVVSLPERSTTGAIDALPGLELLDAVRTDVVDRIVDAELDVLIEDELCHPSLVGVNRRLPASLPIVSLVHLVITPGVQSRWRSTLVGAIEGAYFRSVDGFVFNSHAMKAATGTFVDPEPSVIAHPAGDRFGEPVDAATIDRRATEDPFQVVAVGSVTPRKGIDTLLRGLAAVDGHWRLSVVGSTAVDPAFVRRLRRLAIDLGIDDRVTFTGRVDDETLSDQLASAHVLALPSRYEGFGIVYVEGMGFGLPAIASTSGGAADIVEDGVNGRLVPPESPNAVAAALQELLGDRDLLSSYARNAVETYREHPTWAETTETIESFLRSIAE